MPATRFDHLLLALQQAGLDGLALNPSPTLSYLTGLPFHLNERPTVLLIVPPAQPVLVLPELESAKLASSNIPLRSFTYGDNPSDWQTAFDQAAQALALEHKTIAIEPNWMRVLELRFLEKSAPSAHFANGEALFSSLRIQKDADEIDAMRVAVHIAQDALLDTLPMVKAGVTEQTVAAELTAQLLRHGSEPQMPFFPIVSGGPNSANPHASPSLRPLQTGDLLVIDWGASYRGYISDLTRTFAIGPVEDEFRHIHAVTLQANAAGRVAGRPGAAAGSVDHAARQVIDAAGYGPYFFHRVGHGIGMEGHEPPYMFGENKLVLAPGMTYTVEPGIYLPERGGVRIEDNILVTADGCETLSDLPRDLITL